MRRIESLFMLNQWENAKQERAARMADRLTWLAYGASAGLLIALALFQLTR